METAVNSFTGALKSQLAEKADQTAAAIATTAERARASLVGTAQIPGNLGSAAASGFQTTIADMTQTWVQAHPIAAWFVSHPLVTLGLVIVLLVLLRGLLGAIGRLTEQIWLAFLRLPIVLGKGVFAFGTGLFDRSDPALQPEQPTQQQQLATILDKLEVLKLEQDELIQAAKAIINSDP